MSRQPPGGVLKQVRRTHNRIESRIERLESLLSDFCTRLPPGLTPANRLTLGGRVQESAGHLPVGCDRIDRLLGGGFPVGALSEISGAASSGRTSLALTLLAATTAKGELAGWVDAADAFDPISAERLGVDLDRVLWVRPPNEREALAASERLLKTEGFPLVLLDWTNRRAGPGTASWLRLTRLAAASRTTLLLLSAERLAGPHAALAIEMQPARACFTGTPSLLETLETRMLLVRSRATSVDPDGASIVVNESAA